MPIVRAHPGAAFAATLCQLQSIEVSACRTLIAHDITPPHSELTLDTHSNLFRAAVVCVSSHACCGQRCDSLLFVVPPPSPSPPGLLCGISFFVTMLFLSKVHRPEPYRCLARIDRFVKDCSGSRDAIKFQISKFRRTVGSHYNIVLRKGLWTCTRTCIPTCAYVRVGMHNVRVLPRAG